jgi:GNAT superfamily N-acetyltransferase
VRVTADWDVARLSPGEWETLRDARLRGLLEDPDSFGSSWYEEQVGDELWWRSWLSGSAWFVARTATGESVGVVAGVSPKSVGSPFLLNGMWVAQEARGQGVGQALAAAVIDWTRSQGGTQVDLSVVDGNGPARALFERLGFRGTGDRYPRERDPSRWNERLTRSV